MFVISELMNYDSSVLLMNSSFCPNIGSFKVVNLIIDFSRVMDHILLFLCTGRIDLNFSQIVELKSEFELLCCDMDCYTKSILSPRFCVLRLLPER